MSAVPSKRDVGQRIRDVSRLTGTFTLRSGQVSNIYFDKYRFESEPTLLLAIARLMAPLLPQDTDVLAGLELGGIPLVTVLSQVTGLPAAFIRKQTKTYGTARYAEGADLRGRQVTLVEDVVSSGGAILDTLEKLRGDGIEPRTAVCVIDRETGGSEALAAAGLTLRAVFRTSEVIGGDPRPP